MVITILFLVALFIAGLINIYYFHLPSKKVYAWLQSFFMKSSPSVAIETNRVSNKERSGSKKADLKRVFATFDKNGDGFITKQELRDSLRNVRIIMTENEVEEMVLKVDSNGDGFIDFEEFCILCEATGGQEGQKTSWEDGKEGVVEEGDGEGELKEVFVVFDKDQDGLISVEELGLVLCSLGFKEGKRVEDCKEMIRKVDVDGDGMVNFDEFKRMMRGEGGKLVSVF